MIVTDMNYSAIVIDNEFYKLEETRRACISLGFAVELLLLLFKCSDWLI